MLKRRRIKDINNRRVKVKCGKNTYIDPDTVIDAPEHIRIGNNCVIRKGVILRPETGKIVIGDNCVINHYTVFHAKGGIYLGDNVIIGPHCGFYAQNHSYNSFDKPIRRQINTGKGIFFMGDNWIGGHAVICDDVTLGKGSIVGANSTVTKSAPMGVIVAGNPARIIKKRYSGNWDFHKVERASYNGMPESTVERVNRRGKILADYLQPKDSILDVGCGEGIITNILRKKASDITGCDYSEEALQIAAENNPDINYVHSDVTSLRFKDNMFDKVVLSDIAEHLLPEQFYRCLREVKRVLKPGGFIIIATPLTGNGKKTNTYSHLYEYSEKELIAILKKEFHDIRVVNKEFGVVVSKK